MTNMEAMKLLVAFRESINTVAKKQDELLSELTAIRALLLAVLNGGIELSGRTAEELSVQIQELVEQKLMQCGPGVQEASEEAGRQIGQFISALEQPERPYS